MGNFRKLTRFKQALSSDECYSLLESTLRGVLAFNGEDGYPYAQPINHFYDRESNTVFFHGGKIGYKADCIARSDKVCFTAMNDGERMEGEWWLTFKSVIVFGRIEKITDQESIRKITRRLCYKFTKDENYIEEEIQKYAPATLLLALHVEDIQGKKVREK
ncbi:MAG TPA: 5-nitroimidazole antibiotic resistance protein [Clostridiales bacterium]|nr:5-nitroimidazole antibiotic resistance protein [Clostridiales bacterium]